MKEHFRTTESRFAIKRTNQIRQNAVEKQAVEEKKALRKEAVGHDGMLGVIDGVDYIESEYKRTIFIPQKDWKQNPSVAQGEKQVDKFRHSEVRDISEDENWFKHIYIPHKN